MENPPDHIGILVFVSQETLDHKKNDGKRREHRHCYWDTARMPVRFTNDPDAEKRLYMAVGGQVLGYFVITTSPSRFIFFSESWVPLEDGPVLKPSQGWRYFSHEEVT